MLTVLVWELIFGCGIGIEGSGIGFEGSSTRRPSRFVFDFVGFCVQGFCDPLSNVDLPFVLYKGVDSGTASANDVARY